MLSLANLSYFLHGNYIQILTCNWLQRLTIKISQTRIYKMNLTSGRCLENATWSLINILLNSALSAAQKMILGSCKECCYLLITQISILLGLSDHLFSLNGKEMAQTLWHMHKYEEEKIGCKCCLFSSASSGSERICFRWAFLPLP